MSYLVANAEDRFPLDDALLSVTFRLAMMNELSPWLFARVVLYVMTSRNGSTS